MGTLETNFVEIKAGALEATGLDVVQAGATYAGIHTLAVILDDGSALLAYELDDGTAFVVRGKGRNDYSVARVNLDDDPLTTPPTAYDEGLNLAEVVRVLTFARVLPATATPCSNARKRWLARRS